MDVLGPRILQKYISGKILQSPREKIENAIKKVIDYTMLSFSEHSI
jgi:hypothetical protein